MERGGVAVSSTVAAPISAAGRYVVFATGRTIRALDVSTRRVGVGATAAAAPIGLSVEGTRVAWAENLSRDASARSRSSFQHDDRVLGSTAHCGHDCATRSL